MFSRILVPVDGTACGEIATQHAVQLAKALGSRVVFLFVVDALQLQREGIIDIDVGLVALRARGTEALGRAVDTARLAAVACDSELTVAMVGETLVARAAECDLLVMGTHRKGLLRSILGDSVTERVVHHVTCPLLLVQCPQEMARRRAKG